MHTLVRLQLENMKKNVFFPQETNQIKSSNITSHSTIKHTQHVSEEQLS